MPVTNEKLDEVIHNLSVAVLGNHREEFASDPLLAKLTALGSELWIDTGDLEKAREIWKKELSALTTNNTLANQVVQSGVMDEVIGATVKKLKDVASHLSVEELVLEIGFVINCKIALRLVEAFKTHVSVELHPAVSRDIERTLHFARRYYRVCPEYFIIKVPLTPEGLLSVRHLRKENMPINFTLGFSARQNYLAARLSNPNFVNVFLGRLNQVVSDNAMGSGENVGEKVTLATQRALSEVRKTRNGITSRLIGASIRNGDQVAALAGLDVLTIPPAAMKEFQTSGRDTATVVSKVQTDLAPGIDSSSSHAKKFPALWEVPESFHAFVDELMNRPDLHTMTGPQLVKSCEAKGVNLFHGFSASDLKKIRDHGKIPRLGDWGNNVALDDLMTTSALESFSKDQDALDGRIRSFLD